MTIRWTRPALRDLEGILDYVATENPHAAATLLERIESRVATLAVYPQIGRLGRVAETRELVVTDTSYLIPYRMRGGEIEILAVLHAARRWPESFP